MLAIAGQTARPNGLTFLRKQMGTLGVTLAKKKNFKMNFLNFLFNSTGVRQRRVLQLVLNIHI